MRATLSGLVAFFVLVGTASAASPDIVISQVYGGGGNAGATLRNDFIELYNRGTEPVLVTGWSVQYGAAGGTTYQRTPLTGTIRPGRYYLVQEAAGAGGTTDLPTPNATGGINMSGTAGKVALVTDNVNLPCGADCDGAANVRDFVGYGPTANDSETLPTAGTSNTTAALRNGDGTVDTDNNAADFTVGVPNPRNTPPPASITATDPADGENDVPLDSNVSITLSAPVDPTFAISCTSSGAHGFTESGGPTEFTLDPATDFAGGESCTVSVTAEDLEDSFSFSTVALEGLRIHDIQGAQHRSPYESRVVSGVPGVVTARASNGFWYQDTQPDRDEKTSEGIFVFTGTGSNPAVVPGDAVTVDGVVEEFRPGATGLTITEIGRARFTKTGTGAVQPTVIGFGGRLAPIFVIDDDAVGGNPEDPATPFDPREDGIDFHESVEGMLIRLNNPLAVGPTSGFDELPVAGDFGLLAFPHTLRGGLFVHPNDFNPERFILDAEAGFAVPDAHVRDRLSSVNAVGHYSFSNYKYFVTSTPTVHSGGLKREITQAPKKDELAAASMNVENLDPTDPPAKFTELAEILVDNMRSPDLVAIEEVQDNDGAANSGNTDASLTYTTFIAAIQAAGGPTYQFRQINPNNNQDGGEPGGNIRVGFLFRTDRGLSFVDRPGGDANTAVGVDDTPSGAQLTISPGRIDPASAAWANSRKPLVGEFRWKGQTVFAVANHFNSKGGDDPLFGRVQPPVRHTETQRHQQATEVAEFVQEVLAADRNANVVVLGDLNDFEFSETLEILEDGGLFNLMETLPVWERYSYVFEGNSQTLDQILVSKALKSNGPGYDSVHVNAEFFDQVSDHDPQIARLEVTGRRR